MVWLVDPVTCSLSQAGKKETWTQMPVTTLAQRAGFHDRPGSRNPRGFVPHRLPLHAATAEDARGSPPAALLV